MVNVRLAGLICKISQPVWEMTVHLAVAGDVIDDVLFCAVFFPKRCLG